MVNDELSFCNCGKVKKDDFMEYMFENVIEGEENLIVINFIKRYFLVF